MTLRRSTTLTRLFRRPATPRLAALASSPHPGQLDAALYPDILNLIITHSSREVLLAFRRTCRRLREVADGVLAAHLRISGRVEAPDGRIPQLFPAPASRLVSRRVSRLRLRLQPPVPARVFATTRVVDIATPSPPAITAAILQSAHSAGMIRLVPAVAEEYRPLAAYRRIPPLPGLTVVHFWMERTCLLPTFPPPVQRRITKVVFTIRHYRPVPARLRWYEAHNCWYPSTAEVVFIFGSNGDGAQWITDPNLFHREAQPGDAGAGEARFRPCMFTALVEQVARILLCTRARVSLVALKDVPHPRLLGVLISHPLDGSVGEELEAHFLDAVERELTAEHKFGVACDARRAHILMRRVEVLTNAEYAARAGGQFALEVRT